MFETLLNWGPQKICRTYLSYLEPGQISCLGVWHYHGDFSDNTKCRKFCHIHIQVMKQHTSKYFIFEKITEILVKGDKKEFIAILPINKHFRVNVAS